MKHSISVVIPFYHAEEFFDDAYQSIKQQTRLPNEIIVVIDGCGNKAEKFLEKFADLTVISLPENVGPAKARNIGINTARSNYIAFLDADDKWAPNKLEQQMAFLAEHSQFSSCHTAVTTFHQEKTLAEYKDKPFNLTITDLLVTSHVVPTAWLIKKSALLKVNKFDTNILCSEDHDLTIKLVLADENIGFLNQSLSYLRREDHGNISSNGRKIFKGHLQLFKKYKSTFNQYKQLKYLFLYKTCMTAGGKSSGLEKRFYYSYGAILKLIYRI